MRALCPVVIFLGGACGGHGNSMEGTVDPPGKVHTFDAIAALPRVTAFAGGGARLVSITATGVRANGTMDLEAAYYPKADYVFLRAPKPVDRKKYPVGTVPDAAAELATVGVRKSSVVHMSDTEKIDLGMAVTDTGAPSHTDVAIEPPACTFVALWEQALGKGAPKDGVARIRYGADGYELAIDGTPHDYHFDASCRVVAAPASTDIVPAPPPVVAPAAPPPVVAPATRVVHGH